MLTVLCYFWHPDPGSKFKAPYTSDDVRALKRMVKRHLSVPHEFAVVTDRPHLFDADKDIRAIPMNWEKHVPSTCYSKLFTFHPDGAQIIGERALQIDLDTIVVGDMNPLVERDEDLVLWRNPTRIPWEGGVDGSTIQLGMMTKKGRSKITYLSNQARCYYNSSFLLHRCGTMPWVWNDFDPKHPPAKDDQWYLSDLFGQDCAYYDASHGVYRLAREDTPGSGVDGELPDNARVVTFPGSEGKWTDPRIAAANPWIAEHLSGAGGVAA